MIKRGRGGQFNISFGMIFSIIIIIVTVLVAFYVIRYFMNVSACTQSGMFYQDLQTEVDKAFKADIGQQPFSKTAPAGVTEVCFGNLSKSPVAAYRKEYDSIKELGNPRENMFYYPDGGSCNKAELVSFKVNYIEDMNMFCVKVVKGKISLIIKKGSYDALVKLEKAA